MLLCVLLSQYVKNIAFRSRVAIFYGKRDKLTFELSRDPNNPMLMHSFCFPINESRAYESQRRVISLPLDDLCRGTIHKAL